MARGAPDYLVITGGRTPERGVTYSQIQVPIHIFDDFESVVIKWQAAGCTVSIDTSSQSAMVNSPVVNGSGCLKIVGDAGVNAYIQRYTPLVEQSGNIAVAVYFTIEAAANFKDDNGRTSFVHVRIYDGTYNKEITIFYNPVTYNWYYSDDFGTTKTLLFQQRVWDGENNYIKAVIDLVNNKILSVWVNSEKYTFTDADISVTADTQWPECTFCVYLGSASGKQATLYIDDYKVTYNEPE